MQFKFWLSPPTVSVTMLLLVARVNSLICNVRVRHSLRTLPWNKWGHRFQSSLGKSDLKTDGLASTPTGNDTIKHDALRKESGWCKVPPDLIQIPEVTYNTEDVKIVANYDLRPVTSPYQPSPVETVNIRGRNVYLKRDDLLKLQDSHVSGNKARKMFSLNQIAAEDFPDCIVSYGGPQSNAMVALAAIVRSKNDALAEGDPDQIVEVQGQKKRFLYFAKKIPRFLRKNPSGNYFRAQSLGIEIQELPNKEYDVLFGGKSGGKSDAPVGIEPPIPGSSMWIPQGGACGLAVPGGHLLAKEIVLFWGSNGHGRPLSVLVPGGTCSTALVLHREIRKYQESSPLANALDIEVIVIPCVGDFGYASRQMMSLNMETGGKGESNEIPRILKPSPDADFYLEELDSKGYYPFGRPNADLLDTYRELERNGVQIDLLYGAPSWTVLLRHWSAKSILDGREIMYVHSGGLEGVNSQLMRYRHQGLIKGSEVQHPERQRRSSKEFLGKLE